MKNKNSNTTSKFTRNGHEIKKTQKQLERLFAQLPEPRPRETVDEIDGKIRYVHRLGRFYQKADGFIRKPYLLTMFPWRRKLQVYHETHSMPLNDEKEIVRQIQKLQTQRRTIVELKEIQVETAEAKEYGLIDDVIMPRKEIGVAPAAWASSRFASFGTPNHPNVMNVVVNGAYIKYIVSQSTIEHT